MGHEEGSEMTRYDLFGWLLKGGCDVSGLDGIIFVVELVVLIGIVCVPLALKEVYWDKKR